jgi:hypothetical protein
MRAARRPEMWRKSHAVFANTLALAAADNEGIFHFLLLCRVALGGHDEAALPVDGVIFSDL